MIDFNFSNERYCDRVKTDHTPAWINSTIAWTHYTPTYIHTPRGDRSSVTDLTYHTPAWMGHIKASIDHTPASIDYILCFTAVGGLYCFTLAILLLLLLSRHSH